MDSVHFLADILCAFISTLQLNALCCFLWTERPGLFTLGDLMIQSSEAGLQLL
jgi:hypothetical protein